MKTATLVSFIGAHAEEMLTLHIWFQRREVVGKSSQSFHEACEASITLITKPDKANLGNKNYRPPNEQRYKLPRNI